jgi:hypothetical protein
MFPVRRRINEEDVVRFECCDGGSQQCWLRLLQLVLAKAGAGCGVPAARSGVRPVRDGAGNVRRGAAGSRAVYAAAAVVMTDCLLRRGIGVLR